MNILFTSLKRGDLVGYIDQYTGEHSIAKIVSVSDYQSARLKVLGKEHTLVISCTNLRWLTSDELALANLAFIGE